MQIKEAIERLKSDITKPLYYGEQTIVNIEDLDTVLNELEKKDKVINEIEDLCIRKSDEEGREYGGVIIWNFANKTMDIIKKAQK